MADPCSKYGSTLDGGNVSRPGFPAYLPSQAPSLASHFGPSSADMQGSSSGVLNEDKNSLQPGGYSLDDIPSAGDSDPSVGVSAAASIRGYILLQKINCSLGDIVWMVFQVLEAILNLVLLVNQLQLV